MSIVYRCDRCNTEGATFTRRIDVSSATRSMSDPSELDLCGYCWSKFLEWLRTWPEEET